MANNIEYLFNPASIAVVGVSEDPHKLASIYFNNLVDADFPGKLYPVNPKYEELYGFKCYPSVSAIPEAVDQVAILIPASGVLDVITDAAQKGVKTALIISAGFGEMGQEGKELERKLVQVAKASGMRILGPNIIGVINTVNNVNSSWMQLFPERGNVSFLSQSGAFCTAVLDMAIEERLGFANFCSIGNKADIDELDLIDHWYKDNEVKVIGAYLEEIKSGFDLIRYLKTYESCKPVIIFKPGKSNAAAKAISSHTGAMAGSLETVTTAIRQSGMIEVTSTKDMMSDFMTFSWSHLPEGKRVAIITNAGGPGIIATDSIVENGLELAELSETTIAALQKALPPAASPHNPVDILGDALAERYLAASHSVINDPAVDILLFIVTPQYITQIEDTAKVLIRLKKSTSKPVFTVFLGEKYVSIGLERMHDVEVPVFNDIDTAIRAIADLVHYGDHLRNRQVEQERQKYSFVSETLGKGQYTEEVNSHIREGQEVSLPDELISKLAAEVGFDTPRQKLCSTLEEAVEFASECYPVVIKAPNELLAHKTDFKAVYVNLGNEEELRHAYEQLVTTVIQATNTNSPTILVQEQISYKEEILIGANRDGASDVYQGGRKGFGHLLLAGKGGIYTEVYKDLAHLLVPVSRHEMEEAFDTTRISRIIRGVRGQEALAFDKIINAMEAVQKLVLLYPQIASMDINPLLVNSERAVAVDIKLFVQA